MAINRKQDSAEQQEAFPSWLSEWVDALVDGRLDFTPPRRVGMTPDLAALHERLKLLQSRMKGTIKSCVQLAEGNFKPALARSQEMGELDKAISAVANTLRDASEQADTIASGDFRADIKPKGKNDTLGIALQEMTRTLRMTAETCRQLSIGDTSVKVEVKGDQDMLGGAVNEMVDTLRDAAEQADVITSGNFNADITPRGPKDRLGIALQSMTQMLRTIAETCQQLATGDTSVKVERKGDSDILGKAINEMVDTLRDAAEQADVIAKGDLDANITPRGEKDRLGIALQEMTQMLRENAQERDRQRWHEEGQTHLSDQLRGDITMSDLGKQALAVVIKRTQALVGAFYAAGTDESLELVASQAFTHRRELGAKLDVQHGLLGQAIAEQQIIVIESLPTDYMPIGSALGETTPRQLMMVPFYLDGALMGALELATLTNFDHRHIEFVKSSQEAIAISLAMAKSRVRNQELLEKAQTQSEELQTQQEELRVANEELEEQTERLKVSEEELREHSDRQQSLNAELEEKSELLERQKEAVNKQNRDLRSAQQELEVKAQELQQSSTYKSEFLANMSHELRTPLNSLLLLSHSLMDNPDKNLNSDQVESIQVIHKSGSDLLTLINDILDLSKVEAGKMDLHMEPVDLNYLVDDLKRQFQVIAREKKLYFKAELPEQPINFISDLQRISQVLKNLLSNAFKFTNEGGITLRIHQAEDDIVLEVVDTGIGIPADTQHEIWDAFRQADGSTSRKYGGTGLGLSISRQLGRLLGGELTLESVVGEGATFALRLPLSTGSNTNVPAVNQYVVSPVESEAPEAAVSEPATAIPPSPFLSDERCTLGDRPVVLIVEDDIEFARILQKMARDRGFDTLVTPLGREAFELALSNAPAALLLDLGLPDIDGEKVLELLKANASTRHIPVHVVTGRDKDRSLLQKGAVDILQKPVEPNQLIDLFGGIKSFTRKGIRHVLVVEDNKESLLAVTKLLENQEVKVDGVANAEEALEKLKSGTQYGCIVLDLGLPGMSGEAFLDHLDAEYHELAPPVVVLTGKEMTEQEFNKLRQHTNHIVLKGAAAENRLLDEVMMFLHTLESRMSQRQREMIKALHKPEQILKGRKVLLVDDDIRNTFALSKVLTKEGMDVVMADDGQLALQKLEAEPDVELVLMDIMMPVMDGYEAIKRIRDNPIHKELPIIALTAKVMPQDRAKCLAVGANDFLAKPVDLDKLLSLMRVWLFKRTDS
jgi:CheY-like chemotaxis protein